MPIDTLASDIRNFVNDNNLYDCYYKAQLADWHILCAAMDSLEDAEEALYSYESTEDFNYLILYGMLQAVFLQQEAIIALRSVFGLGRLVMPETSAWNKIRDLRNTTAAHPNTRDGRSCFITRAFMSRKKLHRLCWDKKQNKDFREDVPLEEIYLLYKQEAAKCLDEIRAAQLNHTKNKICLDLVEP
jgi:hypothetical protein